MEHKNIRLIIVAVIAFTILSAGFSITVTKNNNNSLITPKEVQSTTYVLQLGSKPTNSNNGQKQIDDFLVVIENNKGILYKVANSYCRNIDDRKDLIQEIIIQLWKSFDNYDKKFKHSTWMFRISLNVAISFYRKENSRKRISNSLTTDIFNLADIEISDENETNLGLLNQAISKLNDLNKALILLYLEEKNYKEILEIMGITETNVALKISRIKDKLKNEFNQ